MADSVGLDTIYSGAIEMYDKFKEAQYTPHVLLRKMVAAKLAGAKDRKALYDCGKVA
jgi:3-hydroxyacyl-CoA dehydrogenase